MTTLTFRFDIGQHVRVVAMENCRARVSALTLNNAGAQVRIEYWHDGARHVEWVFEDELEEISPGEVTLGFCNNNQPREEVLQEDATLTAPPPEGS